MSPAQSRGPLSGVRLLDLTTVVAGPYFSEQVGDLGADVIKVESPEGDVTRNIGPRRHPGMSAQFLNYNRNKRSVVLDLKQPEGKEALRRLVRTADAFAVNMRPQALERLQIDYRAIAACKPDIVYLRIVGFGVEHPDRDKPALDDVIQAASGIVDLQQQLTGEPSYVGLAMADLTVGLTALSALLAGLYSRAQTGEGDEIEVRMYDSMAAFVLAGHLSGNIFDPPLGPPLNPTSIARNRRPFRTLDGVITVAPYSDSHWLRFCAAIGRPDIGSDPRFANAFERFQRLDELYVLIRPVLETRTTAEWLDTLAAHDIPCGRVNTTSDVVADPALRAAGLLAFVDHPTEGRLRLLNSPIRFAKAETRLRLAPPALGADTDDVLAEIGYSKAELSALSSKGVTRPAASD